MMGHGIALFASQNYNVILLDGSKTCFKAIDGIRSNLTFWLNEEWARRRTSSPSLENQNNARFEEALPGPTCD
jgi:hypothetical protein